MQKLRERLKDQKGFTLVEMLIVVAIIAILIATSIPMVNSALEKSRHAVDEANWRNAISLANVEILSSIDPQTGKPTMSGDYYYAVDDETHQSSLTTTPGDAEPTKCTGSGTDDCGNASGSTRYKTNCRIKVTFTSGSTEFTIDYEAIS